MLFASLHICDLQEGGGGGGGWEGLSAVSQF